MADAINPRWAWEPYKGQDWNLKKAGHLYRRASFGATWTDLQTAVKAGPERTIDALLRGGEQAEDFDRQMEPLAQSIATGNNAQQAGAWWLFRMLYGSHPLREKLTLFWHNHFATSNAKVLNAGYMLGQYRLMHRHALGSFRTLLQEMSKDPAMMVWLDTSQSKKEMPNENYARELMELFSLGIGNYAEKDVREGARAFTGWTIQDGKAVFNAAEHDPGEKTVIGKKGRWKGEDIVRICLEHKACPYFITGKLFRFLISETEPATPELLEPLASQFRKSDYDFGGLVSTMLRSNLFFSPTAYRSRIKSPVDFALGTVRAMLDLPLQERERGIGTTALATALDGLGQNLFHPPTVKGWDGGTSWLNGQTLLYRQNLALALTSTEDARFVRRRHDGELAIDPARLIRKHGKKTDAEVVDFFLHLFLQGDVPAESRAQLLDYMDKSRKQSFPVYWTADDVANHRLRSVCHLVLTMPEFQLD